MYVYIRCGKAYENCVFQTIMLDIYSIFLFVLNIKHALNRICRAIEVATSSITESCSVLSLNIRQQYYCGIIQIGYPSPNLSMKTWPFNIFIIVHYIYMQIRYFHLTESLKIIDEIWPPQI